MTHEDHLHNVTQPDSSWEDYAQDQLEHEERDNRNLLIAARVLRYLRENGLPKSWLATEMGLTPQRVGVILKGRGNMTLDSISQLEQATGLQLLEVPAAPPATATRKTSWHGVIKVASDYISANVLAGSPPQDCVPSC